MRKNCPECSSTELYTRSGIPVGSSQISLLPGLGSSMLYAATVTAVVCQECGYVRFFADEEARGKLSAKWSPLNDA